MLKKRIIHFLDKLKNHSKFPGARLLINALDNFLFEPLLRTKRAPHIRDSIDVKRWMGVVALALLPCSLAAIWNSGLQEFIYSSGNFYLMGSF